MVIVRKIERQGEAELQALVLRARGIDCEIIEDRDGFSLLVSPERLAEAEAELKAFDEENVLVKREAAPTAQHRAPIEIALVYCTVMLFFFAAARRDFLSI